MSGMEDENTVTEDEVVLEPATDFEDLFSEPEELDDPVIPDDLSEDELRSRLVSAEKKAQFERTQRLTVARKNWVTEAKEHYPYSTPEKIKAESRRSFLEEAKEQDADFRERAKPILDKAEAREEEIRAALAEEEGKKVQDAWGKPHTQGGVGGEVDETDFENRIADARKRRDLVGAAKALMDARRL